MEGDPATAFALLPAFHSNGSKGNITCYLPQIRAGTCPPGRSEGNLLLQKQPRKTERSKQPEQNPYYKSPYRNGQANANQTAFRKISVFSIHLFIFLFK